MKSAAYYRMTRNRVLVKFAVVPTIEIEIVDPREQLP